MDIDENYLLHVKRALGYIFEGRDEAKAKKLLGLNEDQLNDLKELRGLTYDKLRICHFEKQEWSRRSKTIPASDVGVSLRISEETVEELKRIEHEHFMAVIECQNKIWD